MLRHWSVCLLACISLPLSVPATAQLSSNPDKFLGNITTDYNVDYGNEPFYTLWNQITPENESKWSSVQGWGRYSWNWGGVDNCVNYARNHGFPFKFHTLVWGSQFPGWVRDLSASERYDAIVAWMDAVKNRYPDLEMIDVVNEAIPGHQSDTPLMSEALGGAGVTGYDWIIKAFEMAHERWPNAILIYNDFNTFRWQINEFIALVKTLRDAGAPIDAYGCQSHDLTDMEFTEFKSAMDRIQNELQMPMYSTEYDIGTYDDALQKQRYMEQIPYMWEKDYCAGITLWGYIYGHTWTENGNSGIIRDGSDRPAMTWLRDYMQSNAAKTAKSPFPGMKKEASVYVKPASLYLPTDEPSPIEIDASLRTKTVDHVELYVDGELQATINSAPYTVDYEPTHSGKHELKAILYATDGTQYERVGSFTAVKGRAPFDGEIAIPGTLEVENFDSGMEGNAFHDSDSQNAGTSAYRSDGGGVDIVDGNGGYAIGYTAVGEWLEYTVNVAAEGRYTYEAVVSSGLTGSGFSVSLVKDGQLTTLCQVDVPQTADNNWNTYTALQGELSERLEAGRQTLRITITGGYCNIDKIVFKRVNELQPVVIRANNQTRGYGDATPELTYTVEGGPMVGEPVLSCAATPTSPVGTYDIVVAQGTVENPVTFENGQLTITKAALTAKGGTYTKKQGEENPPFPLTYEGFKNNETEDVLTVKPTATTEATKESVPGNYVVTVTGGESPNYAITCENGLLTVVNADPVTVTARSYSREYGLENPAFEYDAEGATLDGTPELTCEATAESPVGTYPIIIKKGSVTNYNDTYVNGTLTITKAPLKATTDHYYKKVGEENPTFTVKYGPFRNNETADVLTVKPTAQTTATSESSSGDYPITVSGGEAENYEFEYGSGTLTIVGPDDVTLITACSYTREYGVENPSFDFEYSGPYVDGMPEITCEATSESPVGVYPIVITRGTVEAYNERFVNGTLTITKVPLTVTCGDYTRREGEENPVFELTYEGFRLGETPDALTVKPMVTTVATKESPEGVYEIVVSGGEARNYDFEYVNGRLTVLMSNGIQDVTGTGESFDVYTLSGQLVRHQVTTLKSLPRGVYVVRWNGGSRLCQVNRQ